MNPDFEMRIAYEKWANELWLNSLINFSDKTRADAVFRHITSGYSGWLSHISDWPETKAVDLQIPADLDRMYDTMRRISKEDLAKLIVVPGSEGRMESSTLGEILHHILNHATYHRGHLRGLAEAEGLTDFPETDFHRFARIFRALPPH